LIIHLLPKTWQQLQRQEAENYYVLGKRHLNEETREANMSNRKSLKLTSIAAREPTCYSDMKYLSDYNFIVANTKW
jgi:FtsZ-interacting cell division protein YlmF